MRKTSRFEFEYNYTKFYAEYIKKIQSISNRRKKWVATPLLKSMNKAYISIMRINQYLFTKQSTHKDDREELILQAIQDIYRIQKPLFTYWNIEKISFEKQVRLCSFLNKEIQLLGNLLREDKTLTQFVVIDWNAVNKMKFLQKMCELHTFTHSKLIRAIDDLENTETSILAELIDTALYQLILANKNIPTTKQQYLEREKRIDTVLQCLDDICIPLCSYFNIMQYTDKTMRKWICLIEEEKRLLLGLKKSDRKNFSYLINH